MESRSRKRKKNTIVWPKILLSIVLIVILVLNISVICMGKAVGSSVLNQLPVAMIPVLSDSMKPDYKSGDAILTKQTDYDDIQVGDVIVYSRDNDLIVHEVIAKQGDYLITKGKANPVADNPVTREEYRTKVQFKIPLLGGVWRISSKPLNFVLFAILIILLLFGDKLFSGLYTKIFEKENDGEDENN